MAGTSSRNNGVQKMLKAVPIYDQAVDREDTHPLKFFVLEGRCKKCGMGDNCLVYYNFRFNQSDKMKSVFKTQCLCCGKKDNYYSSQVLK